MNPGLAFDYSLLAASVARDAGTLSRYAATDSDGDGLADGLKDIGADEFTDSDNDGLPDWIESLSGSDLAAGSDDDSDYLTNLEDYNSGANPLSNDTDGDGLLDGDELFSDGTYGDTDGYTTEVNNSDTDADELSDGWEVTYGFNPTSANAPSTDSDGDGLTDAQEFSSGGNPFSADTDGDGMPDLFEFNNGLNLAYNDTSLDRDSDALSNLEEYQLGTQANYFDSDGDGLPDGWEHQHGLDLLTPNPLDLDTDGDGLDLFDEYLNGTDPNNNDSDGDATNDQEEVDQGSDPTNGDDGGNPPPADTTRDVKFGIYGDYASWEMTVKGLGPDRRTLKLSTAAPGGRNERSLKLRHNSDYEIRLRWLATLEGQEMDWYCWEATVDGLPTEATYTSYNGTRLPEVAEFFPVANDWIVDNRQGLLTSHVHMNADEGGNVAGG